MPRAATASQYDTRQVHIGWRLRRAISLSQGNRPTPSAGDCSGRTSVEQNDKEVRRLPLPLSTPLASTDLPPGAGAPMPVGLPLAAVLVRLRTCRLPVSCLSAR